MIKIVYFPSFESGVSVIDPNLPSSPVNTTEVIGNSRLLMRRTTFLPSLPIDRRKDPLHIK